MFDDYAHTFDESLKELEYSVPEILREVLGGMKPRFREVFDAGCGTGLLGPLVRDISGTVKYCMKHVLIFWLLEGPSKFLAFTLVFVHVPPHLPRSRLQYVAHLMDIVHVVMPRSAAATSLL